MWDKYCLGKCKLCPEEYLLINRKVQKYSVTCVALSNRKRREQPHRILNHEHSRFVLWSRVRVTRRFFYKLYVIEWFVITECFSLHIPESYRGALSKFYKSSQKHTQQQIYKVSFKSYRIMYMKRNFFKSICVPILVKCYNLLRIAIKIKFFLPF